MGCLKKHSPIVIRHQTQASGVRNFEREKRQYFITQVFQGNKKSQPKVTFDLCKFLDSEAKNSFTFNRLIPTNKASQYFRKRVSLLHQPSAYNLHVYNLWM